MDTLFVSPREFSRLTGIPKRTVYDLVREGHIAGKKLADSILIPRSEAERLLKEALANRKAPDYKLVQSA